MKISLALKIVSQCYAWDFLGSFFLFNISMPYPHKISWHPRSRNPCWLWNCKQTADSLYSTPLVFLGMYMPAVFVTNKITFFHLNNERRVIKIFSYLILVSPERFPCFFAPHLLPWRLLKLITWFRIETCKKFNSKVLIKVAWPRGAEIF